MPLRWLLALLTGFAGCSRPPQASGNLDYQPQTGDFLFQSLPKNPLIVAIEGWTGSAFSHCGIALERNGQWFVLEAIGPVKETPISLWIAQGRNNAFVAYRPSAEIAPYVPAILRSGRKLQRPSL